MDMTPDGACDLTLIVKRAVTEALDERGREMVAAELRRRDVRIAQLEAILRRHDLQIPARIDPRLTQQEAAVVGVLQDAYPDPVSARALLAKTMPFASESQLRVVINNIRKRLGADSIPPTGHHGYRLGDAFHASLPKQLITP
jgi:hypothetical protein